MPNGNWILGDLFLKDFGHEGSIAKLWEMRWKFPCKLGVYPFHDGKFEDFEPIFTHLIANNINDPFSDDYTEAFLPTARNLTQQAQDLTSKDKSTARALYLRANAVFRLSRFPYIDTPLKQTAFSEQKSAYLQGASLWDVPITETIIPHAHAFNGDDNTIPLYIRKPPAPDLSQRYSSSPASTATARIIPSARVSISSVGGQPSSATSPVRRKTALRIGGIPYRQIDCSRRS
ncbi:hypothetical protein GRF29_19g1183006 [Pseudopithomyces chartarum]|uniref:Uncharacterized protein n=1 Tax=Pseudopithomyces chartarum TaxID=1892770 RepID=A0AAN6RIR3_9PLEO|nr:hypothetical protein GRF29_19g1183006 [Pseudopithomyces chartarum]